MISNIIQKVKREFQASGIEDLDSTNKIPRKTGLTINVNLVFG